MINLYVKFNVYFSYSAKSGDQTDGLTTQKESKEHSNTRSFKLQLIAQIVFCKLYVYDIPLTKWINQYLTHSCENVHYGTLYA